MDVGKRLVQLAEGVYIEHDTLNIVQRIQEYDKNLVVKFLDPDKSDDLIAEPYRIYEKCPDGFERMVFGVWELNELVLERLYAADRYKHDILGNLDSHNRLMQERENQRYKDKIAEANDIAAHYFKSPKTTYSFVDPETGNKVKLDSQEGRRAKVDRQ